MLRRALEDERRWEQISSAVGSVEATGHEWDEDPAARLVDGLRLADLGVAEGRRAGRWRREAAERGITLSQADCLVAAAAMGVDARLATGNPKHFPMEELEVEHWPAGA